MYDIEKLSDLTGSWGRISSSPCNEELVKAHYKNHRTLYDMGKYRVIKRTLVEFKSVTTVTLVEVKEVI